MQNMKSKLIKFRLWNWNSEINFLLNSESPPSSASPSRGEGWGGGAGFQRGFTLIEMIVVIVILGIVSAITIKFLVDSLRTYTMTVDQKSLFDEGKLALERMCRDLRDAYSITTPSSGGSSSSGTLLSFTRTNATAQDSANDTIQFILSSGTLQRKASTRTTVDLASYVTAITVTRGTSPNNEITISLTLSRASSGVTLSVSLGTKVIPKNFPVDTTYTYKNFKQHWEEQEST